MQQQPLQFDNLPTALSSTDYHILSSHLSSLWMVVELRHPLSCGWLWNCDISLSCGWSWNCDISHSLSLSLSLSSHAHACILCGKVVSPTLAPPPSFFSLLLLLLHHATPSPQSSFCPWEIAVISHLGTSLLLLLLLLLLGLSYPFCFPSQCLCLACACPIQPELVGLAGRTSPWESLDWVWIERRRRRRSWCWS